MKTLNERVLDTLSELYRAYGYAKYKMSGFEEYDLYAANRDFLVSGQILTFTGADGRLMALKPDVTMSIIKDAENEKGRVDKYFYSENVYRVPSGAHEFREIMQTGIECVGDIGDYDRAEAVFLACRSLAAVSEDFVVDISHMGLVSGVLDKAELDETERAAAIEALKSKNCGALAAVCARLDDDMKYTVMGLVDVCGVLPDAIEAAEMRGMNVNEKTAAALLTLRRIADAAGESADKLRLDFSVVHDMNYYDGIVFAGYVLGIPESLLRGGEYGCLIKKMGRVGSAVGFAVYTDLIDLIDKGERGIDADILLVCGDDAEPCAVADAVERLRALGRTVLVQRSLAGRERCRKAMRLSGRRFEEIE